MALTVFDELKKTLNQPRVPKGSPHGGEFASVPGHLSGSARSKAEDLHEFATKIVSENLPDAEKRFKSLKPGAGHHADVHAYYKQLHAQLFGGKKTPVKTEIPEAKFSDNGKSALSTYVNEGSGEAHDRINTSLRTGGALTATDKKTLEGMDEAFVGASFHKNITVYRGVGHDIISHIPKMKVGETVKLDEGFLSTSKSKANAEGYADESSESGLVFTIHVPKGARAVDVEKDVGGDWGAVEQEVLIDRGSHFKVKKVTGKHIELELLHGVKKSMSQPRVPKGSSHGGEFAPKGFSGVSIPAKPFSAHEPSKNSINLIHNLASKIVNTPHLVKNAQAYLAFGKPTKDHEGTVHAYYDKVHQALFGGGKEEGFKTKTNFDVFGAVPPIGQLGFVHGINTAVENHQSGVWDKAKALQHISDTVTADAAPQIKDYANTATKHLLGQHEAPAPVVVKTPSPEPAAGHGVPKPQLNGNAQQMNAWGKKLQTIDSAYQSALAGHDDPEKIIATAQPNKTAHPKVHAYFKAVQAAVLAHKIELLKGTDPAATKVLEVKKPEWSFGGLKNEPLSAPFEMKDNGSKNFPGASSQELDSVLAANSALTKLQSGQWDKAKALDHLGNWAGSAYNHPATSAYVKQVKTEIQAHGTKPEKSVEQPSMKADEFNALKVHETTKAIHIDQVLHDHGMYLKGHTGFGTNKQDAIKNLEDLKPHPAQYSKAVVDFHQKALDWVKGASNEAPKPLAPSLVVPDKPKTSGSPPALPASSVPKPASSHAATQAQINKIEIAFKSGSPALIAKVTPGKSAQKQVKDYHAAMLAAHQVGKQGNVITAGGLKPAVEAKPVKSLGEKLAALPPASQGLYVITSDGGTTKFEKISGQLGSNAGGVYADPAGAKHYAKFQKSEDHATNEALASHLYKIAGSDAIEVHKMNSNSGPTTLTKWQDGLESLQQSSSNHKKLADEDFATHAWLGNWDAIGAAFDNQKFDPNTGKMKTVDVGGSLFYRAQGGEKTLHAGSVPELESLKSQEKNPQAAAIFGHGKLTEAQLESMKKIALLDDNEIKNAVIQHAPNGIAGNSADEIMSRLIKRKNIIAETWAKETGKNLDALMATKVQVKVNPPPILPDELAEHAKNLKTIAQSGNLDKLSAYNVDNLGTHWKTTNYHDYKAFKEYKKSLETVVQDHLNNVPPPNLALEHHAVMTPQLKADHPSLPLESVPSHHQKLYDYAIIGKSKVIPSAKELSSDFKNIAVTEYGDSYGTSESGHLSLHSSSPEAKVLKAALVKSHSAAVADPTFSNLWSSYKGSGYSNMNDAWRKGNFTSHYGQQVKKMLDLLAQHSTELPEGIVLHRGVQMPDNLHFAKFQQNIGSIIQEPSLASTSWGPYAAFSGNNTQLHIHTTKGVRGMSAKGKGAINIDGEREIVLLPGTRYLISKVVKKGDQTHVHVLAMPASQFENANA